MWGINQFGKLYTTVTILFTSDIRPIIAMADKKRQAMDFLPRRYGLLLAPVKIFGQKNLVTKLFS